MTQDKKSNGGEEQSLPPVGGVGGVGDVPGDLQALNAALAKSLEAELRFFAPHLTDPQLSLIVENVLKEQAVISNEMLPVFYAPSALKENPFWGVKLGDVTGGKGHLFGPKTPAISPKDQLLILQFCQAYALAHTPMLRMVLRAYGFKYEFGHGKAPAGPAPKVTIHRP